MSDRRQEILNYHIDNHPTHGLSIEQERIAIDAMDQYMTECCLSLLQYIADKNIRVSFLTNSQEPMFMCGMETLTKEQIFENFL